MTSYAPYVINVEWNEVAGKWFATCPNFPSLSWVDITDLSAARGLLNLINKEEL